MKKSLIAMALFLGVFARPSSATSIIQFDVCSSPQLCGDAKASATLLGNFIDFAATSNPFGIPVFTGDANNMFLAFNVAGSGSPSVFFPGFSIGPSAEFGPYGTFEYTLMGPPDVFTSYLDLMITQSGGYFNELDMFEANGLGYLAAAYIRDPQTGVTGYVAADDISFTSPVPEPGSMMLLASGLGALVARRRYAARQQG